MNQTNLGYKPGGALVIKVYEVGVHTHTGEVRSNMP